MTPTEVDAALMLQARRAVPLPQRPLRARNARLSDDFAHDGELRRNKEAVVVTCSCGAERAATGDAKPAVDAWVQHAVVVTGVAARADYGEDL